jgi:tetratricopeptide (TPR) repeat protein
VTKRESRRSSSQAGKGRASGAGSGIIGRLGPSAQSEPPPPAATPMDAGGMLEQMMRQIQELIAEEDFKTQGEAEAFMRGLMAGQRMALSADVPGALVSGARSVARKKPKRAASDKRRTLSEAQDLIYEAWDAPTVRESARLAKRALRLSPDCADAYVILGDLAANSPAGAKKLYEQGVAAAERVLGPAAFVDDAGHFWGLLETRPYMRARFGVASAERMLGNHSIAIAHLEDMLRLNPEDNQGVRYILLNWLLAEPDRRNAAAKLLNKYDDASAEWSYGRSLHLFKMIGASKRATAALRSAIADNHHVPVYLMGTKQVPEVLPTSYGFGDDSEAILYSCTAISLWNSVPGAIAWLGKTAGE